MSKLTDHVTVSLWNIYKFFKVLVRVSSVCDFCLQCIPFFMFRNTPSVSWSVSTVVQSGCLSKQTVCNHLWYCMYAGFNRTVSKVLMASCCEITDGFAIGIPCNTHIY